jgi:hypothetical protein
MKAEAVTALVVAHPDYFEPLSKRNASSEYETSLRQWLPHGWNVLQHDTWLAVARLRTEATPSQGFKIHVSSIPSQAETAIECVASVCVAADVDFKIAADPFMLTMMNGKRYSRGGSGKFAAIYPRTDEQFKEVIEALYQRTRAAGLVGPYILSDRRYKDSPVVYYRYGGFRTDTQLRIDGTSDYVIRDPDGNPVVDERLPYFKLPAWVSDPFGGTPCVAAGGRTKLRGRYEVRGVLTYSNTGGVYWAVDQQTGREVIVKEARPHTGIWGGDGRYIDAPKILEREYEMLRLLHDMHEVPEALAFFTEWEHSFLVQERVAGVTYHRYWASANTILAPFIHRTGRIESFLPRFRKIALGLLDAIEAIHARGVVLADVSPNNVFVEDPESLTIRFIDLESAIQVGAGDDFTRFAARWITPGFARPERAQQTTVSFADDLYAVAMLLHSAVFPVQSFLALEPTAEWRFIEQAVALGLPETVLHAIRALADGDSPAARGYIDRLCTGKESV